MTETSAWLQSTDPPAVDSRFELTLRPATGAPLAPRVAYVVAAQVDAHKASACGFEVVFAALNEDEIARMRLPNPRAHEAAATAERRTSVRVATTLRALVRTASDTFDARIVNLSVSGALLEPTEREALTHSPEVGGQLLVELVLDSRAVLRLDAGVVRVDDTQRTPRFGVHFHALEADDRHRLEELVLTIVQSG